MLSSKKQLYLYDLVEILFHNFLNGPNGPEDKELKSVQIYSDGKLIQEGKYFQLPRISEFESPTILLTKDSPGYVPGVKTQLSILHEPPTTDSVELNDLRTFAGIDARCFQYSGELHRNGENGTEYHLGVKESKYGERISLTFEEEKMCMLYFHLLCVEVYNLYSDEAYDWITVFWAIKSTGEFKPLIQSGKEIEENFVYSEAAEKKMTV